MNISIFYLIRGKPDKYIQKLIREVGPRFGERYMIEHPLPSHITLRSPFETKNVKEIEEIIRNFAKRQKPSKIEINGFGNFNRFVSFVRPILSKSALKTQKELIRELDKMGIKPHPFDKKFKPHMTIVYGNEKKTFDKIWEYLGTLKKPKFDLRLDNLAIAKKVGKRWKVYREFKIK